MLQKLDISLVPGFKQLGKGKLGKKIEFVLKEGILCRKSFDHTDKIPEEMQIVIPTELRKHIKNGK